MATNDELEEWKIASTGKMISYSFGYVIINFFLYYGLSNLFYFYEVEIGLPVLYIVIAFVIFAIWNMINDPLFGYLTEKPTKWTKKWGFRAPWIVFSAVPVLLLYIILWTPPIRAGTIVIFLWFIIMTCLFDLFFSIYNDHVYGGFTNQFPTEFERRRAFSIATLFMGLILTLIGIVLPSIFIEYGKPETFVTVAVITVIILVFFNIILFLGIRESKEMKEMFIRGYESIKTEQKGFFQVMKIALKRKNYILHTIGYTLSISSMFLFAASTIYLFKDIFRLPYSYFAIPAMVGLVAFLASIPFWNNYIRKHGFKKTYWLCFITTGLAFIPFLWIGTFTQSSPVFMLIEFSIYIVIRSFFYCGLVLVLMPVASDTCDEVSLYLGRRQDGMLTGIRTFFFRLAFIIVPVIIAVVHIVTMYNPDPYAIQTPLAIWGIRVQIGLIPCIFNIVAGLIFRKYYDLDGKKKEEMMRKVKDMGLWR